MSGSLAKLKAAVVEHPNVVRQCLLWYAHKLVTVYSTLVLQPFVHSDVDLRR